MIGFKKKFQQLDLSSYFPLIFILLFVLIISQYSFSSLESFFYDLRIRYDLWTSQKIDFVIVKIDEESDLYLGEKSPYTYATYNVFIENLIKARPKAILFLAPLDAPDGKKEFSRMMEFRKKVRLFVKEEKGIFHFGTSLDSWGENLPPESLRDLGHSLALIHTDSSSFSKDDVCRKAILRVSGDDSFHLWVAKKLSGESIRHFSGESYSYEADATFVNFRYSFNPNLNKNNLPIINYYQVVSNNIPENLLEGKVVLVGTQYASNPNDFVLVPFNKSNKLLTPKLNVHAAIIEAFYQFKTIYHLSDSVMTFICLIMALVLSYINFRLTPVQGIIVILLGILLSALVSFGLFNFGIWIHWVKLMLTFFIVYYIWVPYRAIAEYQIRYSIEKEAKLLKEVDHLKRNFLSLMSHDLKTPVAKIIGKIDNLMNIQNLDQTVRRYLQDILSSTNDLNHFITKILDLTKTESQSFTMNKVSRDINKIISEVVDKYRADVKEKKMEIHVDLYPLFPILIDAELMKRVLSNLIENAIKYSGENSSISIKSWDEGNFVFIQVKDSGRGLSEEELPRIFEKFYRVKGNADEVKGTGLGLYLVRYFVELHGGTINVQSMLGKGTTFTVKLKNN